MTKIERTLSLQLPVSSDQLGRWLESKGGEISIQCMLGTYHVTVSWQALLSSSDDHGQHSETWRVSRYGKDLPATIDAALSEAQSQTAKAKP